MTTDGRTVCALRAEADASRFASSAAPALLAQLPGASFYHRLREKFGRLAVLRPAPDHVRGRRSVGSRWYT